MVTRYVEKPTAELMRERNVYYDAGLRGWLKTTAIAEHWRVASWQSADDLVQEGFICYCKCRDAYTLAVPEPGDRPDGYKHQNLFTLTPSEAQRKHFMSLVQRSFYNHIYTLAQRYPATREQPIAEVAIGESNEEVTMEQLVPPVPEEISALVVVLQAPAEIADAIVKLVMDGRDGSRYIRSRLREHVMTNGKVRVRLTGKTPIRETSSEHMARILGDPALPAKVMNYLMS